MENRNNKGLRNLAIIALLVAVAGISVAFAALAQTLTINATGTVKGAEWNIKWTSASGSKVSGGDGVSFGTANSTPTVNLTISGIILEYKGDKVQWVLTSENLGTIDARLDNITNVLSKSVVFDQDEDSTLTADDIKVTLTKNDSPTFSAIAVNDSLDAGTSQQYLLTVEFDPDLAQVPSHDVEVVITSSFPWIQK